MEEIELLVVNKLSYYKDAYITADEMHDSTRKNYYGKCIAKCNRILELL
jgi:hypothetical protein